MSNRRNSISLVLLPRKVLGISTQTSKCNVEQQHPTNVFRQKAFRLAAQAAPQETCLGEIQHKSEHLHYQELLTGRTMPD